MENIKNYVEDLVKKISSNKELLAKFKSDPKAAIKSLITDELGDDILEAVVAGVKAKLAGGSDGDGGLLDKAGDLLGKAKGLLD